MKTTSIQLRNLSDAEIKGIQMKILEEIHGFCVERNIRYSLSGGSLLGAVRHGGYIPWDDDIDLMMPRPDYERFIMEFNSIDNELLDLRKSATCVEMFVKVSRRHTYMTDRTLGRTMWGVNVDVFPIDVVPSDFDNHYGAFQKYRDGLAIVCPYYREMRNDRFKWMCKYFMKRMAHPLIPGCLKMKKKIDGLISNWDESSTFAGVLLGSYGKREIMPADIFSSYKNIDFEGEQFRAIEDADSYLTGIYGNYMSLPPMEKRVTHHLYDVYIEL